MKPLVAKKEKILNYNIDKIWDIVVDNANYQWRSGVENVEILENGNSWIEYYSKKSFTKFTLVEKNRPNLYSFKMDNRYFYGDWTGEFMEIGQNETKYIFTETIYVRSKIMMLLAKPIWNIKALQERYFNDLEKELGKRRL